MEREHRHKSKEEKKHRGVIEDEEEVQIHQSYEDSRRTREKRKSRDRSLERDLTSTREEADHHRNTSSKLPQREDRWCADERADYGNERNLELVDEGRVRDNHLVSQRSGPPYRTQSYDQTYYLNRFNDHYQFRGGHYQRRPYGRGRGRGYFGSRNFGFYRKDEVAPERYNPMEDQPPNAMHNRRQEDWDRQDRWPKSNLDADLNRAPPKEPPRYHDAMQRKPYVELRSPKPHSPSSIKRSPDNPRCNRRSLYYRSRSPSPMSSRGSSLEAEEKKMMLFKDKESRSPTPKMEKQRSPVPQRRQRQGNKSGTKRMSSSSSYTSSGRSRRKSSTRSSSGTSRSPRRDLSPFPERRSSRRDYRPRESRLGYQNRGRYSDSYRGNRRFRGTYSGGRHGLRRGVSYKYNARNERRHHSRSRSREYKKRRETQSRSRSDTLSTDRSKSLPREVSPSKERKKASKASLSPSCT